MPNRETVQVPKGYDLLEVTSDPRVRGLLRGDLDDYYIAEGRVHRSKRELVLGVAWGMIAAAGIATLIIWNVRVRRPSVRPVVGDG